MKMKEGLPISTVEEVMKLDNYEGVVVGTPTRMIVEDPKVTRTLFPLRFTLDKILNCKTYFGLEGQPSYEDFAVSATLMHLAVKNEERIQVYGSREGDIFIAEDVIFPDFSSPERCFHFQFPYNRLNSGTNGK